MLLPAAEAEWISLNFTLFSPVFFVFACCEQGGKGAFYSVSLQKVNVKAACMRDSSQGTAPWEWMKNCQHKI